MSDPKERVTDEPRRPSPPEMEFEPIPLPDEAVEIPLVDGDELLDEHRVPAVESPDEANIDPDEALPDEAEEAVLNDDPAREKIRFDEEVPKSSR